MTPPAQTWPSLIDARKALELLAQTSLNVKAIDVRSESEFEKGAISGFLNVPILNNSERHQVGLCYKNHSQAQAIELGHKLVAEFKGQRINNWLAHLAEADLALITCWRGGLRSEIAAQWIREASQTVSRVDGGYQAMRSEVLKVFYDLPELWVLAGPTGSGKTKLIQEINTLVLDLEHYANHRGSAFGGHLAKVQPHQASFENNIALDLIQKQMNQKEVNQDMGHRESGRILVEDESYFIGRVHLPEQIKEKLDHAPVIRIRDEIDNRVSMLHDEYVVKALNETGQDKKVLMERYLESLLKIKKKLGGLATGLILKEIKEAFAGNDVGLHHRWIKSLLENYYDKMYEHSFKNNDRKIIFEGDWHQCKQWIQNQFASQKP